MKELFFDSVVIGGGAAGMAAALEIAKQGFSVTIIEREEILGGILMQCIHNGFGLQVFKEELTGPEYAERFAKLVYNCKIPVYLNSTVIEIKNHDNIKEVFAYSKENNVINIKCKSIVLAMGCRERNRGNIRTPGSRPAGIYTAGLAQRLVNIEGYLPGKDVVIVGSGDIGLIMARRMTWSGCNVKGVVEIQPFAAGLTRNIVQCLNDFDIPLYLSHVVSYIHGKDRVESVTVTPLKNNKPDYDNSFDIKCDTILLSVGLIPENELSIETEVQINQMTNGAIVDSCMMTSVDGIFSCGNVLHVHDLVDYVTEEARVAGQFVAEYLKSNTPSIQFKIKPQANVRYVNPSYINPERESKIYFRSMIIKPSAIIQLKVNNFIIKEIKMQHIHPSEMISITITPDVFKNLQIEKDSLLSVSII